MAAVSLVAVFSYRNTSPWRNWADTVRLAVNDGLVQFESGLQGTPPSGYLGSGPLLNLPLRLDHSILDVMKQPQTLIFRWRDVAPVDNFRLAMREFRYIGVEFDKHCWESTWAQMLDNNRQ